MKAVTLAVLFALPIMPVLAETQSPFVASITTVYGETFKNCQIIKATPAALTVVHDNGVAKLGFDLLNAHWRTAFKYDPREARKFVAQEAEERRETEILRKQLNERREREEERFLAEIAEEESRRVAEQDAREREMAEQAAQAMAESREQNALLPSLEPLPGEEVRKAEVTVGTVLGNAVRRPADFGFPFVTPLGPPYAPQIKKADQLYRQDRYWYYLINGYPPYVDPFFYNAPSSNYNSGYNLPYSSQVRPPSRTQLRSPRQSSGSIQMRSGRPSPRSR